MACSLSVFLKKYLNLISCRKIEVAYDLERAPIDGIGAQLQRRFSVLLVAKYMNWSHLGTPISDLMTRAADFREGKDKEFIIGELNKITRSVEEFVSNQKFAETQRIKISIRISSKNMSRIMNRFPRASLSLVAIFVAISRVNVQLLLIDGFFLTNVLPDLYDEIQVPNMLEILGASPESLKPNKSELSIVVHIRRGEVSSKGSIKELTQRYTSIDWFTEVLRDVTCDRKFEGQDFKVTVLTDSPKHDSIASAEFKEMDLWKAQLGIDETYRIKAEDFSALLKAFPKAIVRSDLDSISSLVIMMQADILVMSKSSFSFIAGIFNRRGLVVYQDFWHKPLQRWLRYPSVHSS